LDYTNAVTVSGYTIPAISTRRAETQVELRDGQSFAISGLLDHRTIDLFNKMPGVGDIPIVGKLFRSKNTTLSTVELVVLVTPNLIDPLTDTTEPSLPIFPVPMLDKTQFDKSTPNQKSVLKPPTTMGAKP
jgi:pilus assembly protein CpaC